MYCVVRRTSTRFVLARSIWGRGAQNPGEIIARRLEHREINSLEIHSISCSFAAWDFQVPKKRMELSSGSVVPISREEKKKPLLLRLGYENKTSKRPQYAPTATAH